jgi:hypothetical protein
MSLVPENKHFLWLFQQLWMISAVRIPELTQSSKDSYTAMTHATLIAAAICVVLGGVAVFQWYEKNRTSEFFRSVNTVNYFILPILGTAMFIPFWISFFDAYVCDEEIEGKQILAADWTITWYEGLYFDIVFTGSVLFALYLAL